MTNLIGRPLIASVTAQRRERILQISRAQNVVRPAILELRSHQIRFRADAIRLGNVPWTVELFGETVKMDEEADYSTDVAVYTPNELSQWAQSLVDLAAAVDATKDKDAKRLLLKGMDGIAFLLDPPRGQLEEIRK